MAGDRPVNRSAEERAYNKGVEMADIKADLAEHGRHLDKINGSQEKTALELHQVSECLDEILEKMGKREAVEEDRAAVLRDKIAKQVTGRQFALGVAGFIFSVAVLFLGAK